MHFARPAFATHPARFGRGRVREIAAPECRVQLSITDDLKLFATTFVGGFLFVSLLLS